MINSHEKGKEKPDHNSGRGTGQAPVITLPKGGGAIRGIGEKFTVNPVNGTASINVPIATTSARSGFGPQLSLSYNSGGGNGPFGLGWHLSLPSVTRKTDKGLPRYKDAEESDTYILSGTEDLVPCPGKGGSHPTHSIQRYRPRIEGLFARIERWEDKATGDTHWRSVSRDNITTLYGRSPECRVADPRDGSRVFSWLIEESYDEKGNVIIYEYKQENPDNIDRLLPSEKNRLSGGDCLANRYIKRIKYGNKRPYQREPDGWLFQVVFDYGDHHPDSPEVDADRAWACRQDPFSACRAGFAIRTYRLCQRVLMFHNFAQLGDGPCLVGSTDFCYTPDRAATLLKSVTQRGYVRQTDGLYRKKGLPPLEFFYTGAAVDEEIHWIGPESLENLPVGLDGAHYQWLDLDSEGLSGILTEQAGVWFYKPNLGNGRFGPVRAVNTQPLPANLSGGQQIMDLAGDGHKYLVQFSPPLAGYYERTGDGGWEAFIPFAQAPNLAWNDANLKFVDLTGDGFADILITEDRVFVWYPSLARQGFGPSGAVRLLDDEEQGPALVFADATQSIHLADMSGDGLADIVRLRNGEVCYWPNLGYGRFGAKVTMDGAPRFDFPDQFNSGRIRLADVDGSGPTDIIYLGRDCITLWFNQAGNGWGTAHAISSFPATDNLAAVNVVDLLGNGTACLVWSSPLAADGSGPMRYIDLTGGVKPRLLQSARNNMGAETRVDYTASTRFYLEDRAQGRPWVTRLPFPVQVIERVETYDHIGQNRFVTRYAYHHGYYDGAEREFRGFGLVEQWDAEEFVDAPAQVPPVYTKTWFHTGAYFDGAKIAHGFAAEYYREPNPGTGQSKALLLEDAPLPQGLSAEEERQSCRALKGLILRQEVYAQDGTAKSRQPYSVSETNYTVECLQLMAGNPHGVFFVHPRETVAYHYERATIKPNPHDLNSEAADPRVSHQLTLKVDRYGNVERSAAIAYPRRDIPQRQPEQAETHITLTVSRFYNCEEDQTDRYRVGLPVETRTYEVASPPQPAVTPVSVRLFSFEEIHTLSQDLLPPDKIEPDGTKTLPYERWNWRNEQDMPPEPRLRPVEHLRTLYYQKDLSGPLALGQADFPALPFGIYKLAFTPGVLAAYRRGSEILLPDPGSLLGDEGGYILSDHYKAYGWFPDSDPEGCWWLPSGRQYFSPVPDPAPAPVVQDVQYAKEHFYLPQAMRDQFGAITRVKYDRYDLLPIKTVDPAGNVVSVETRDPDGRDVIAIDYRVMQPWLLTDPNGNRTQVVFDTLGLVAGMAMMGKWGENKGDWLEGFKADLEQAEIDAFFSDPRGPVAASLLESATTRIIYDVTRYQRLKKADRPVFSATLARENHAGDPLPPEGSRILASFGYSDGFGREVQKKIPAEPGDEGAAPAVPRWVGSGWTLYNNKGKPVKQYEPFFTATHEFEFDRQQGVCATLFYDPLSRVVATLHPNHTYEKVVFGPWQQWSFDVNDTLHPTERYDPPKNKLPDHSFNPVDDPEVGQYFRALPQGEYLPTWYDLRMDPAKALAQWPDTDGQGCPLPDNARRREEERRASEKAARHAGTPVVTHFDTLGRTFLTVTDNGTDGRGREQKYQTRVKLDIEGNQRAVVDSKNREVMRQEYDLLGREIKQASMDAGTRWLLNDVTEKPLRIWDSRGGTSRTEYDNLRRPLRSYIKGTDPRNPDRELLFGRLIYGDGPDAGLTGSQRLQANLRGKVYKNFDSAGVITNEAYDFKGNILRSTRKLVNGYKSIPDWSLKPALEAETYVSGTLYDALSRPVQLIAPHHDKPGTRVHVFQPGYNEASLLDRIYVWLGRRAEPDGLLDPQTADLQAVVNINYNARGQRTLIDYGNGTQTSYQYNPLTHKLTNLLTRRSAAAFPDDCPRRPASGWPGCAVQNLHYTYDPVGNMSSVRDDAQQAVFFRNRRVEAGTEYTYDAIYRLIEATGREHLGQAADGSVLPPSPTDHRDGPRLNLVLPGDGNAMGRYLQQYVYDTVGNLLEMNHSGSDPAQPGWKRTFTYGEQSLLEPGKTGNRLTGTAVGRTSEIYSANQSGYDAHGNMLSMPHLDFMQWNHRDQLAATSRQAVHSGTPETTYYVYDDAGQRVRKVTERQNGTRKEERLYLGIFELYREYGGNGATLNKEYETLHIMDDTQRIALVETRTVDAGSPPFDPVPLTRYQLGNHQGTAGLELDELGRIISYEEYYPYGGTAYQAVPGGVEASPKRYRYTGKERDEESGLYYHGARYYVHWLGRWSSCDPAGLVDGPNLYGYARQSPVNFSDKSGKTSTPNDTGKSGEKLFEQLLTQLGKQFDTQVPLKGGNSIIDFFLKGLFGHTVDTKTRNIGYWTNAAGQLRVEAIKAFELEELTKTLKHMGDSNTKETMLYLIKGAKPEQVKEYLALVRQVHAEYAKTNPGTQLPGAGAVRFEALQSRVNPIAVTVGFIRRQGQRIRTLTADQRGEASLGGAIAAGVAAGVVAGGLGASDKTKERVSEVASSIAGEGISYATSIGVQNVPTVLRAAAGNIAQVGRQVLTTAGMAATAMIGAAKAAPGAIAATVKAAGGALAADVSAGVAATAAVTGAAIVGAAGAVTWAVEDTRRALRGEKTMTDVAVETWGKMGFVGTMKALWAQF
jgi:RHS repeat-associated protein